METNNMKKNKIELFLDLKDWKKPKIEINEIKGTQTKKINHEKLI